MLCAGARHFCFRIACGLQLHTRCHGAQRAVRANDNTSWLSVGRPLELVRPFLSVLPDIETPDRRISFREKATYTAVALFVFLVCSQLPLYGIKTNSGSDPFYWARVIMASNRCLLPYHRA